MCREVNTSVRHSWQGIRLEFQRCRTFASLLVDKRTASMPIVLGKKVWTHVMITWATAGPANDHGGTLPEFENASSYLVQELRYIVNVVMDDYPTARRVFMLCNFGKSVGFRHLVSETSKPQPRTQPFFPNKDGLVPKPILHTSQSALFTYRNGALFARQDETRHYQTGHYKTTARQNAALSDGTL